MVVITAAQSVHTFSLLHNLWVQKLEMWSKFQRMVVEWPSWFVHSSFWDIWESSKGGICLCGHPIGSSVYRNGRLTLFQRKTALCGSRRPSGDLSRSFLSRLPHQTRGTALSGTPQEVIAAIIGWGHWVKRRRTFRDTGSRAKWN